ncbi:6-pyruvoyl trahydropterin synthase family protein [Allonocardiopsis opalescens]|uniref:6-carboxy-5,6,7,8-tetrahydropterin synthase n=1 Tax=Allonocardiopsis opalescens TaxID=1144618 RepID=A0A2T0Q295_9ACTN|nr:6-carboxytetrahydropterin synthase [Allonocardiopsis opalescens]PRX97830.1 6-pyruvoyltetrahydropterin/6-carboxytetrahydropterin synthase [Allonocardiopsis opalescens]
MDTLSTGGAGAVRRPAAAVRTAFAVTVRHNFETAHRLPHLAGKCVNLHGHSWWAEVTVTAPGLLDGTVVRFSAFKAELREWIDRHLDHGAMLGAADPLAKLLPDCGSRVFRFGAADPLPHERPAADLPYPTVEAVAELLARVSTGLVARLDRAPGARVTRVHITETHVNAAEWREAGA